MNILFNSVVLAFIVFFSTSLFANDTEWVTEHGLMKGIITFGDDSQIQVYATQADLDKLQQSIANIQSIEIIPNQTDTNSLPNQDGK
jgi:hypothetical protein